MYGNTHGINDSEFSHNQLMVKKYNKCIHYTCYSSLIPSDQLTNVDITDTIND